MFFSLCKTVLLKNLAWPSILNKSLKYKIWIIWKKSDIKYVQEVAMKMLIVGPNLVYWLSEEVSLKLRLESWLTVIPKPGFTSELSGGAFKKMYVWMALPRNLTQYFLGGDQDSVQKGRLLDDFDVVRLVLGNKCTSQRGGGRAL